ncbi:MAG: hypothetical protein MK085_07070 [Phycisphaerales bacterium]|nr:hypothetical protein [Phycisphaerales bacterium]
MCASGIAEIFSAFGERSLLGGDLDREEAALLVAGSMAENLVTAKAVQEAFLARLSERIGSEGTTRVRRAWMLACYPGLEFRFAPDLWTRPGEGMARLLASGRLDQRDLDPAELAVLDAMFVQWMTESDRLLEEAFLLREATQVGELVESPDDWRDMLRRYPEWVILDERRRELDARIARQVISLFGSSALKLPWIRLAIAPSMGTTTWPGGP